MDNLEVKFRPLAFRQFSKNSAILLRRCHAFTRHLETCKQTFLFWLYKKTIRKNNRKSTRYNVSISRVKDPVYTRLRCNNNFPFVINCKPWWEIMNSLSSNYTKTNHIKIIANKLPEFLKKLWCCIGGGYQKTIRFKEPS